MVLDYLLDLVSVGLPYICLHPGMVFHLIQRHPLLRIYPQRLHNKILSQRRKEPLGELKPQLQDIIKQLRLDLILGAIVRGRCKRCIPT